MERGGQVQSGVAKAIDLHDGNNRLAKLAKSLAHAELQLARLALTVLYEGDLGRVRADGSAIEIEYPTEFDLLTTSDLAGATESFQSILEKAGQLPVTEGLLLSRLLRLCMPGLADDQYLKCDQEIQNHLARKSGMV